MNKSPIIVALDCSKSEEALALTSQLRQYHCGIKIGKELFTHAGPALVNTLVAQEFRVFLDLKFHDIPNTVARAVGAAAKLGVWMINVHALGGMTMLQAAREALDKYQPRPLLIAVSILTSLTATDLTAIGLSGTVEENVLRLARMAKESGLDGLVCSPQEIALLRQAIAPPFLLVTPGIRPANSAQNDQQRIMTPSAAMRLGADYLVIGRPITAAANPLQALQEIEISLLS